MARLKVLGMTYAQYLASDHWKEVRRRYKASDLPQDCLGCGESRVDLHHRTYTRLGFEQLTDLIPLCRECHQKVHDYLLENYADYHLAYVKDTHKILRITFGWTRKQTREKFDPFCRPGRNLGFATNDIGWTFDRLKTQ